MALKSDTQQQINSYALRQIAICCPQTSAGYPEAAEWGAASEEIHWKKILERSLQPQDSLHEQLAAAGKLWEREIAAL